MYQPLYLKKCNIWIQLTSIHHTHITYKFGFFSVIMEWLKVKSERNQNLLEVNNIILLIYLLIRHEYRFSANWVSANWEIML